MAPPGRLSTPYHQRTKFVRERKNALTSIFSMYLGMGTIIYIAHALKK